MSNVLPREIRKELWIRRLARFASALSLILLVVALLSLLALLPSYVILTIDGAPNVATPSPQNSATAQDRAAVAHAQALIKKLSPLTATTSPQALLREALAARPAGISVTHLTVTSGTPGTIILSGKAAQTDAISAYRTALLSDAHFKSVTVPVGDLAGNVDGTFSVTLTADF
jgi:hypothetical protein